jgi:hypothetical protein
MHKVNRVDAEQLYLSSASSKSSKFSNKRSPETLLKPRELSNFWQIEIMMETEQACSLAIQHVENRRKALFTEKMLKLKEILSFYSSNDDK